MEEVKKIMAIWLCFTLAFSYAFIFDAHNQQVKADSVPLNQSALITRPPIRINSDSEFDAAHGITNWATGDGSLGNPWIIEGYEINGTGIGCCIYIGNTTDHFIVCDSYLHNASGFEYWQYYDDSGVYFHNVENGIVINVTSWYNNRNGIYIQSSSQISLVSNNMTEQDTGVNLWSDNYNCIIQGNYIDAKNGVSDEGIIIYQSNYISIIDNQIIRCGDGIILNGENNTIEKNRFIDNKPGVSIASNSKYNTIDNNNFFAQTMGVWSYGQDNVISNNYFNWGFNAINLRGDGELVVNNTITEHFNQALYIDTYSRNNTIINNNVMNNYDWAIDVRGEENYIYHNNFINNSFSVSGSYGRNYWTNGYPSGGNYWDNYTGNDVYNGQNQNFPGSDSIGDTPFMFPYYDGQDDYPLMFPFNFTDISAPQSNVNPIVPYFVNGTTGIPIYASDPESGCSEVDLYYRYSSDNISWSGWTYGGVDYVAPWNISFDFPEADGYYQFYSNAIDNRGNDEGATTTPESECYFDTHLPTTTLIPVGLTYNGTIYNQSVIFYNLNNEFNLTSVDANSSGPNEIWYRIIRPYRYIEWPFGEYVYFPGDWTLYEGNITVANSVQIEWIWYLEFYGVDIAGNKENINNVSLGFTRTTINTELLINSAPIDENCNITSDNIFSFNATDQWGLNYNLNHTYYRLWNESYGWSDWIDYVSNFTITGADGVRYMEYYSIDMLSISESISNQTLFLDNNSPYIIATGPFDSETNVSLNTTIYIQFSESMNITSVEISIEPAVMISELIWNSGSELTIVLAQNLTKNLTYSVSITGTDLMGYSILPNSFSFSAWLDNDDDGVPDYQDTDDDNDGVPDEEDDLPFNPDESVDTDGDGIGNIADTDDDGDGVPDTEDLFPLDSSESADNDGDGIGDNADTDDDNDGVMDSSDAFPFDSEESLDTDGDGIGNNADYDDDGDGVPDESDIEPLNPDVQYNYSSVWGYLVFFFSCIILAYISNESKPT